MLLCWVRKSFICEFVCIWGLYWIIVLYVEIVLWVIKKGKDGEFLDVLMK